MEKRYALVTGASSGMGREYAARLAAKGYSLVMVSNREEENAAAAQEIAAEYGIAALPLCVDLSCPEAAAMLFAETEARGLEVEVLVCNAGMLLFGGLLATPPERIAGLIELHCTTTTLLCRHFAEPMKQRGRGYILIMSSSTAWLPYPTIATYAATKSFLRTFSKALHFELRKYGIRVTGVYPGAVDTPFYKLSDRWRRRFVRLGVMSTPQSVARRGLRAMFCGRSSYIPGFFTKLCIGVCRILPDSLFRLFLRIPAISRFF